MHWTWMAVLKKSWENVKLHSLDSLKVMQVTNNSCKNHPDPDRNEQVSTRYFSPPIRWGEKARTQDIRPSAF